LKDSAFWGSWALTYIIIFALVTATLVPAMFINTINHSSMLLVALYVYGFLMTILSGGFLCSTLFSTSDTASVAAIFIYIVMLLGFSNEAIYSTNAAKVMSCIMSPVAFKYGSNILGTYEGAAQGITFSNAHLASMQTVGFNGAEDGGVSFLSLIIILWLDAALYMALAWYFDKVIPGTYGVARPWHFIFDYSYWSGQDTQQDAACKGSPGSEGHFNVEEVSPEIRLKRGLSIQNLRKEFDTATGLKVAVEDLSLNMYEGQITALLGHNGAGKSTTFNMLTGMLPPTSGDAIIDGYSVKEDLDAVRSIIGVCPQHDVLWDDLSVTEHLELFAALKGVAPDDIDAEVSKLIIEVGLTEKAHNYSSTLSGGMKRKLSVAIALIGGSKIVFLDEPTSGMDPWSRRSTWSLLEKAKKDRVIVLTTHFMDEADLLGDRIAILSAGNLRCCGSSLWLKSRYGLGYNLTVSKKKSGSEAVASSAPIMKAVKKHIPEAELLSDVGAELAFQLPLSSTGQFPSLLAVLDNDGGSLGIDGFGIACTTLEEVFLRLAEGAEEPEERAAMRRTTEEIKDRRTSTPKRKASTPSEPVSPFLTPADNEAESLVGGQGNGPNLGSRESIPPLTLFARHFRALFFKRALNSSRNKVGWIFQFFVPALFVLGGIALLKVVKSIANEPGMGVNVGQYNSPLPLPYTASKSGTTACWPPSAEAMKGFETGGITIALEDVAAKKPKETFNCSNINGLVKFNNNYVGKLYSATAEVAYYSAAGHLPPLDVSTNIGNAWESQCKKDPNTPPGSTDSLPNYPFEHYTQPTSASTLQDANYVFSAGLVSGSYATKESRYGSLNFATNDCSATGKTVDVLISVNSTGYHAAPVFLNLAMQAVAASGGSNSRISSHFEPFSMTAAQKAQSDTMSFLVVAMFLIIAFSVVPATFITFIVMENHIKAKHVQLVSGVSQLAYWLSSFVFDFLSFMVPTILAWIIMAAFSVDGLIGSNFPATAAVFMMFGLAVTPLTYMFSFLFQNEGKALIFTVITYFLCGFILFLVDFILSSPFLGTAETMETLRYFFALMPDYAFAMGLYQINRNDSLFDCTAEMIALDTNGYCKRGIFDWKVSGMWLTYLAGECVLYFALTLFFEATRQSSQGPLAMMSAWFNRTPEISEAPYEIDQDLRDEARKIESGEADGDPIVVNHLRKVYPGRGNVPPKVAVRDMTFSVPMGEVFGFLGINGAGKTTTLSILSGEFMPSSGSAQLVGLDMLTSRQEINQKIGYCPQFDAVLSRLTGREHLEMYARIKGIAEQDLDEVVNDCIECMDLKQYCDREAGGYSGGNKRKLSVAIALVGNPSIVFLDEPSTGMDPEARRFMWNVISSTMSDRAVILTTHSMEEAEALSNRVGIMVGGRLRCLGSCQHLKNRYGKGYTLELRVEPSEADAADRFILNKFKGCEQVEKHGGQMRYEIPRLDLKLSDMFAVIEAAKEDLFIKDYALSQTTLEKIFLSFASQQEEETGGAPGIN